MTTSTSVERRHRVARLTLLSISTILCSGLAAPALAQTIGSVAAPPVRQPVDINRVDVVRGTFKVASVDLTIGGEGRRGLSYGRQNSGYGWTDTSIGTINQDGSTITVTLHDRSDSFTGSGSTYSPTEGNGASLTQSDGNWIYTARDGTVATFEANDNYFYPVFYGRSQANVGHLISITYPDGVTETYTYKMQQYCGSGFEGGACPSGTKYIVRLQSLKSSNGYQLKFTYADNASEVTVANFKAWSIPASVSAINATLASCDPAADTCAATSGAPTVSYSSSTSGNVTTSLVTDPANRVTRYTRDAGAGGSFKIKRPGAASDNVAANYDAGTGRVSSVTREGVTYSYGYADAGSTRTTTVTSPDGGQQVYTSDTTTFLISKVRDEAGQETSYAYDASGRTTQVTSPEGNSASITYDTRGNVTQMTANGKPSAGGGTITTYADFDASCGNAKTCNQPNWTKDAKGNQTDYGYDGATGLVTSVTIPAPVNGAARPQTRYSYTTTSAATLLSGVSQCRTQTICAGTVDEVKTSIVYDANLLPTSVTTGAGDNSLAATTGVAYDAIGNAISVDGPLPGSDDTTTYRFDADRELVGLVSADPDGSGVLKRRATRTTYNADGQATTVEQGTVDGASDADWAAFSTLQQANAVFDANGRKTRDSITAGGTTYGVTQYSYDALGRLDCSATRMDPDTFAKLPASACTLGTAGDADRITRQTYGKPSVRAAATLL